MKEGKRGGGCLFISLGGKEKSKERDIFRREKKKGGIFRRYLKEKGGKGREREGRKEKVLHLFQKRVGKKKGLLPKEREGRSLVEERQKRGDFVGGVGILLVPGKRKTTEEGDREKKKASIISSTILREKKNGMTMTWTGRKEKRKRADEGCLLLTEKGLPYSRKCGRRNHLPFFRGAERGENRASPKKILRKGSSSSKKKKEEYLIYL